VAKSKKSKKKNLPKKENQTKDTSLDTSAWIPMRTGLLIITVLSIAMVVFVVWQTYGDLTLGESIRYGLVRGGSIWIIFLLVLLFNRFFRNR
jgi:hypothetical protein